MAGQLRAKAQARAAVLLGVAVFLAHRQHFVHQQAGIHDHQRGHQHGDRSDRQHRRRIFLEQDFVRVLVQHQRHGGTQRERILRIAQAHGLGERRFRRHEGRANRLRTAGHDGLLAVAQHDHLPR